MKITEKTLDKIPEKNWINFLKEVYDLDCNKADGFLIGKEATNGFLEFKTFCDESYQTFVDVTEEQFKKIKNGEYVERK